MPGAVTGAVAGAEATDGMGVPVEIPDGAVADGEVVVGGAELAIISAGFLGDGFGMGSITSADNGLVEGAVTTGVPFVELAIVIEVEGTGEGSTRRNVGASAGAVDGGEEVAAKVDVEAFVVVCADFDFEADIGNEAGVGTEADTGTDAEVHNGLGDNTKEDAGDGARGNAAGDACVGVLFCFGVNAGAERGGEA